MRPRLHHAFFLEIAMLDAISTRADTEGGKVASGFDDDFGETVVVTTTAGRTKSRKEETVLIPSQLETPLVEALQQLHTGNVPDTRIQAVWARKDLAAMGLIVPESGEPLPRVNDRLVSVRDKCKSLVWEVRTPPGLYITQVAPAFGISRRADLYVVTFEDREQFVRG